MLGEARDSLLTRYTSFDEDLADQRGRKVLPLDLGTVLQVDHGSAPTTIELIGRSTVWVRAMETAMQVAPTDANVLLLGETGTGKELVARSIHLNSPRSRAPFVRLDCSSLTPTLFESELFGHVRGAFTSATTTRAGRVSLAHGGTLFIDEIGDLPLEMQPKLLRLLQEREFEPVGSSHTVHVDLRIIAATHRNLLAEIEAGRFRRDLYYRLGTFCLRLPPLRQRDVDIALLATHFARSELHRLHKAQRGFDGSALDLLHSHAWPGNVRELRHAVERACIVCSSATLQAIDFDLSPTRLVANEASDQGGHILRSDTAPTLRDVEREHICTVLRACNGVIEGPRGAAKILALPASTVRYRMRKLGITSPRRVISASRNRLPESPAPHADSRRADASI
jgi:formate hydrogenlyase transcriptional activator